MTVNGYVKNRILYITLSGEMDECSSQTARTQCDKLIEENINCSRIVILWIRQVSVF